MSSETSTATGWFKSSYSSDAAACVEIKFDSNGVLVGDSKSNGGPTLLFDDASWSAFTAGIRSSQFRLA